MKQSQPISGFSKLSKEAKIEWITKTHFENPEKAYDLLKSYWHGDAKTQQLHDEFIENTITNFYLPFGLAPNFLINQRYYTIPMAIEESSVIAAAAKAAFRSAMSRVSKKPKAPTKSPVKTAGGGLWFWPIPTARI